MARRLSLPVVCERLSLLAVCLALAGCSGESTPNVAGSLDYFEKPPAASDDSPSESTDLGEPSDDSSAPPAAPSPFVPTPEHEKFAADWIRVHKQNDTLGAYSLVDWPRLFDRAFAGATIGNAYKEQFREEIKRSVQGGHGVQRDIAATIERGADFQLLGFRKKGESELAIFRVLSPALQILNYQEVTLERGADGKIRAVEVATFRLDPPYSEDIRAMFADALMLAGRQQAGTDKRVLAASLDLRNLIGQGRSQDAMALYLKLPIDVRKARRCAALFVEACRRTSPDNYVAAIEEFARLFPSDASIPLLKLEQAILQRNFPAQREAIQRVREAIWDDPYLGVLLTFSFLEDNDLEKAKDESAAVLAREPSLRSAHWARAAVLAKENRFDELVRVLDDYAMQFSPKLDFSDWLVLPSFESFRASKEYRDWKDRQSKSGLRLP